MTPTAAYDEIADWYEEEFLSNQRAMNGDQKADPLGISRALRELLGHGIGPYLEIGCGTGIHAATVRELGWTPIGVDLSTGLLRHAQSRLPIARADAERLPVQDGCVPAVIAMMVHTDMPRYPAVLREASRILRPGGVFVHVGVHPCFCGGSPTIAILTRWLSVLATWTATGRRPPGPTRGCATRSAPRIGPFPDLMHAFPAAGLALERFVEGGQPTPVVLAVRARKCG